MIHRKYVFVKHYGPVGKTIYFPVATKRERAIYDIKVTRLTLLLIERFFIIVEYVLT